MHHNQIATLELRRYDDEPSRTGGSAFVPPLDEEDGFAPGLRFVT